MLSNTTAEGLLRRLPSNGNMAWIDRKDLLDQFGLTPLCCLHDFRLLDAWPPSGILQVYERDSSHKVTVVVLFSRIGARG
jgi:hypothetical protein